MISRDFESWNNFGTLNWSWDMTCARIAVCEQC